MKILVATDGSENSKRALLEAKKHAEGLGGSITVLTVINCMVIRPYAGIELPALPENTKLEDVGKSFLDEAKEVIGEFDGELNTKMRSGNPADEILKEAASGNYDLIILGSRGQGTFSRAVLGSISNKVLNNTKRNVLVVK